jgi:hypothetical protein
MPALVTLRGELRCFSCSRYLGEFESHPQTHGPRDLHLIEPTEGALPAHAVQTERGLRCSACNGRAVAEYIDNVAA